LLHGTHHAAPSSSWYRRYMVRTSSLISRGSRPPISSSAMREFLAVSLCSTSPGSVPSIAKGHGGIPRPPMGVNFPLRANKRT
jgi:hypothetical protein